MLGLALAAAVVGTGVITNPDWDKTPSGDDMARFYPLAAQVAEQTGSATIECAVKADGSVSDCAVTSETPTNWEFGQAALNLAPQFKMKPQTKDGQPVAGAKVRIPVGFRIAGKPNDANVYWCYAAFANDTSPMGGRLSNLLTGALATAVSRLGGSPEDAVKIVAKAQQENLGTGAAAIQDRCRAALQTPAPAGDGAAAPSR